ncbi:hypothetical protein [Phyllobacterium sp. K27]
MLAKVQKPDKAAHFRAVLHLPERSAEHIAVEQTLRDATDARSSAAKRLEDARVRASVDGSLKRRSTVTPEQIAILEADLQPLIEAEKAARAALDILHQEYAETSRSALGEPISEYLHHVAQKAAEMEELAAIGASLINQVNRAQITLNSTSLKSVPQMQNAYLAPMLKVIAGWR